MYWVFLALLILIVGCASSSSNENYDYEDLVSLQKPQDQPHQASKIYIDSLKQITHEQEPALLIHGTFPDACTKLEEVSHRMENDSLYLDLKAWRNPDKMCAQVLTPFSYIYEELNQDDFSSHSEIIINNTAYSL